MTDSKNEPIRNIAPFGLRMQADLKAKLQEKAEKQGVSLNELISSTLSRVHDARDGIHPVVVRLPDYLVQALSMTDEGGQLSTEHSILKILKTAFPDPDVISSISQQQDRVFIELWKLQESDEFKLPVNDLARALHELLDTVSDEVASEALERARKAGAAFSEGRAQEAD